MAVTSQQVRIPGGYVCDGIQQDFAVPWMFHYTDALLVILRLISDGSETVQVLTTHYTVTGADVPSGGNVHMLVAPSALYELHIIHDPDLFQRVVLVAGAAVPIVSVERQMDDEVHQNQRTRDLVTRGIYLADTDTDGSGAFDARSNKIKNLDDPVSGQDAATKAWVGTQTILSSGLPGPGTLTNAMWNPGDLLALTNSKGLTAAQMDVETDPFNAGAGPISPSVNQLGAWERIQFQIRNILNWLDAGARTHAYQAAPGSNLPAVVAAQIAAALGAAGSASNVLTNGSLFVSQREPSESATGTIATGSGNEAFPVDRFAVRCEGATMTWNRTVAAGKRHSASKSYIGLELVGAFGMTDVLFSQRLSGRQCKALGFGSGTAKNYTFGFKVRHSGTGAGSITPNLRVRSCASETDNLSSKFDSAVKTLQHGPTAFAALTTTQEASYIATYAMGTITALANGVEFEISFTPMSLTTDKITVSDVWLATADISSTLMPDDFYVEIEKCKRHYQKTFEYATRPAQNVTLSAALVVTGGNNEVAFTWPHAPALIRAGATNQLTWYSVDDLSARATNGGGVDRVSVQSTSPRQSRTNGVIAPSGTKDEDWYVHAAVDAEWYD